MDATEDNLRYLLNEMRDNGFNVRKIGIHYCKVDEYPILTLLFPKSSTLRSSRMIQLKCETVDDTIVNMLSHMYSGEMDYVKNDSDCRIEGK